MTDDASAREVAQAIASLRWDLLAAIGEGSGAPLQFGLGDVQLTLQLVATKHGGGKVGWSLLGIDGWYDRARTHTVTITLQPMLLTGSGSFTRDFSIAAQTTVAPQIGGDQPSRTTSG